MEIQNLKFKGGFSLLEIMVTVAIISIMSGSVVIGFNSFAQTVRLQETAGVITDMIKNMELEMIRRDYVKQTIHFEPDYLVVEAEVESQNPDLLLSWISSTNKCNPGEEELNINNKSANTIYLAKRDKNANNMEIKAFRHSYKTFECITFKDSEETEWQYQLFESGNRSQIIRFLHFNIRRGNSDPVEITSGNNYTLEITAPYASKTFYSGTTLETGNVEIEVKNKENDSPETITLQEE